jgi:hypothetical protein
VPLADAVGGWQFHLDHPLTIAAIGLWDEGKQPLSIAHEVGLWSADSILLVSVIVDNNSLPVPSASSDGQWLFTSIVPLTLPPGNYVMGAVWGDPIIGADPFRLNANATSFVNYTGPCATFLLTAPDLVFPDCGTGSLNNASYFGPNLAIAVPEPNGLALLLIAAIGAFAGMRLRS